MCEGGINLTPPQGVRKSEIQRFCMNNDENSDRKEQLWDQQKDETAASFELFQKFMQLGHGSRLRHKQPAARLLHTSLVPPPPHPKGPKKLRKVTNRYKRQRRQRNPGEMSDVPFRSFSCRAAFIIHSRPQLKSS